MLRGLVVLIRTCLAALDTILPTGNFGVNSREGTGAMARDDVEGCKASPVALCKTMQRA